MAYGYYMTPAERERYDQQRLFQSIASVGQTSPYYALGLALGQGLGNAYGNMAEERQANKLDAFVNEQLSPSTKIKMQDEYLKGMLQPDAQNEIKTLTNTVPGQMNAIGEAKTVQVPEQQGFNAPSRTDISEYARQNGVSNKVLNSRMADYQEQIKERAREYFVPRIGNLVENGALTNNNGLAQLYNETRQYSVYDDEGAKNVMSALGQMAKPVNVINKAPTQRTLLNSNVGGTKNENTTTTDTRRNQNNGLQYKFADLMTLRKQYTDSYNSAVTNGDDTAAKAYKQQIDNLDGLINKTLYPQTDFAKEYPEEYEDKTYQELAAELGVLPNNIANFGRAEEPKKEPVVNTPLEQSTLAGQDDYITTMAKSVGKKFTQQGAGVIGGQLQAANVVSGGKVKGAADAVSSLAKGEESPYNWEDILTPWKSDFAFYKDPEHGVVPELGGLGGSMTALASEAALIGKATNAAFNHGLVPQSLATATTMFSVALSRIVPKWVYTGLSAEGLNLFGKALVNSIKAKPLEILSNGGNAAEEYLKDHPNDYDGAGVVMTKEIAAEGPLALLTSALSLVGVKSSSTVAQKIYNASKAGRTKAEAMQYVKGLGGAVEEAVSNWYEEYYQERANDYGLGKLKYTDVWNPFIGRKKDYNAAAIGALAGIGAAGSATANAIEQHHINNETYNPDWLNEQATSTTENTNIANSNNDNIAAIEKEDNENEKEDNENVISLQQLQNEETEKPQQVKLPQDEQVVKGGNNGQEAQVKTILENAPADKVKYYAVDENGETVSIAKDFFDVQLANAEDVKSADNVPEGQVVYEFTNRGNKYFATIDTTKAEQPTGQPTEQPQEQPVVEPTGQVNTDTMAGAEPTNVDNTQQRVDYWQDAHSSPIDNPTFGRMTTESGNTVAVRYGFTNPDVLNVSHDPFTYEPNANYDQRLQQRNRQGIQMKQQVENNAARLNPALLGYSDGVNMGAPVVITDSNNVDTVINGNGRAMAIIRAMQTNPENIKAYHEYLIKHAYDYGWTPEQATQYIAEHPKAILVRQVNEDDNMIQDIAGATGGGMSLSAAEQAARDASKVPEYVWQKYQPNEKGEIDNTSNHEFVDGVLKNITNQNEINEFMPDINGDLSVPGAMRVRNALFAYAYGDKRLISDVANFAGGDSMTSQVVNGLTRAAGDVAKARAAMKSNGKEELNFIPKLVEAARTVRQFGRDEQALEKEINSISMFSEEDAGRNIMALDDETKRVLAVLFANKGSGANIGKFIKGMANAVIRTAEAETDVFGADDLPKTIMDVIEEGAKVGGIKQTDLGKKEGAENGYNARTRGNTEEGNSQEQSSEIGERGEGESREGTPATTSTADTGRTPATTGEVAQTTEQLAEQLENKPKDLMSLSNDVEATAKEGEKAAETEEEKKVNSSKTDEIKFFTEATKYLYTVIPDAIQRSESIEETHATILANDEYTSGRVFNDVVNEAKEAFKGADIVPNKDNKTFTIKFKNGQNVTLDIVDEIIATPEDMERYKAAHGKLPKAIKAVTKTKLTKAGLQAIVQVSTKNSQYGDLFHESFHIAAKLFLSGKQYNSLMDYFDKTRGSSQATPEELAADGYKAWRKAREERRGTLWGKLYQKVLDGCNAVLGLFNTKKRLVNNIFKQMESGELFNGKVNTETKDSIAFTGTDEEKNTALNSVVATPQRTGWKGAFDKGGVKAALDYLFTDFYTKMVDKYYAFEKFDDATKARKAERIIDKVHMLNANTEGNTNALIQGDATDIKVLEKKLNINLHDVTLKNVLSVINPEELDKLYPDYLKEQNKEGLTWIGAFDNYLVWRRLLEMAQHHDQEYIAEYKEWMKKVNDFKYWQENDGADATRPEAAGAEPKYKPYVLPKVLQDAGITEADLKNKIKAAPAEFERAANLFYQWNDNILSVLEQGGVIDGKLHNLLNTKYKNYCSLMRDFSDENSIEDFVAGLTNGGKGIGNVKQMIKRISLEGSERAVLSPLEVAVKSCAIAVNRAERNKVAQFAVKKLLDNGFGILEEAKGETRPNPLKSIFTVMENGKTVAYKCNSPELYQAITMMDANVANSLTDALSTFAKTLRWGATISPSFIIRNGIRDTVQAFVVGEDGFIPVIDTIVGIYKYYNNPEFKAEIDAAGIAMFTQFGKSSTTKNTVNNANKGMTLRDFVGSSFGLEYISSAIEKGTRAGLYNNARKSGKSMDEAQLSAVRGTLNFSRSGSIGQHVNKIDAFFNATIQGLDQLFRVVGGGMKATYNVASGGSKLPPPPPPNASQRDIDDYNSRKEVRAENLMKMKRLARILYGFVIPSIMLYLWISDKDWYEDLDPGIKYTNWILPNRVMLPMPHEYGVFAGFTMATLDYMKKHDRKAYEHWRKTAANSLAINILPTAVIPILENATNYSFFAGKPLENQNMVRNLKPGERYSGSTSEVAKSAGQYFNVSPIKIDNLVRGYTGTTGTFVMKDFGNLFYELTGLASTKPYKPMSEKTFIRDFNVTDYKLRRYTEEFMNMAEEARQNKDKYKKYLVGDGGINKLNEKINELFRLNRDIDLGKKYPKHSPEFKKQLKDKNLAEIRRLSKLGVERFGDKIDY